VRLHNRDFHAALATDAIAHGLSLPEDFCEQVQANNRKCFKKELRPIDGVLKAVSGFPGPQAAASSSEGGKLVCNLQMTGLNDTFAPHIHSADLASRHPTCSCMLPGRLVPGEQAVS
jgi:beta-phosphoglucomutase-like phosphatase (HAD superfamily)